MNIKRRHLDGLERQRFFDMARGYLNLDCCMNTQQGQGFAAVELGWPRTACPYRNGTHRGFWHFGYSVGLAALELGLISRSIQA